MNPYTVIVRHPGYADQDDNGWAGTFLHQVNADYPEDAFGMAQDAAMQHAGFTQRPEDWAVVAIFAGHLQCLHIP